MPYERGDRRYGGGPYDDRDRGFFERAGDEVRSWFGDEEAERRRRLDERYDEHFDRGDRDRYGYGPRDEGRGRFVGGMQGGYRSSGRYPHWDRSNAADDGRSGYAAGGYAGYDRDVEDGRRFDSGQRSGYRGEERYTGGGYGRGGYGGRDRAYGPGYDRSAERHADHHDYAGWRDRQIGAFDRDYDEYRRENRSRFESEFAAWRQNRQGQRDALGKVTEHQEVVGSDGGHVGKVDHVRGDHILLTKTDRDAGGHHHGIPSSWIASVDDKVHLAKTADEAKAAWREADEHGGPFDRERDGENEFRRGGGKLNRSFPGTY